MIDVCLLGQGGMYPLPHRFLTSLSLRYQGEGLLVDCGEGTQVAMRVAKIPFKPIHTLCITHFHADHIAGLPGLLLTMGNAGKTEPLRIIGPVGIRNVVEKLCVICPVLPFALTFEEITPANNEFWLQDLKISTLPVIHGIPCFAYSFSLERGGKFDVAKATSLEIPKTFWGTLQKGESVVYQNMEFYPSMVVGPPRKGLKVTYATDLRPSSELVVFARNSDLFICEGNYGDPEKIEKAIEHQHCMFSEAATMAKEAEVVELWLTHFSPSLSDPEEFLPLAQSVFQAVYIDKHKETLCFKTS